MDVENKNKNGTDNSYNKYNLEDNNISDINDFEKHVVGIKKAKTKKKNNSVIDSVRNFVKYHNDEDESEDEDADTYTYKYTRYKKANFKRNKNSVVLLIVISILILTMTFVLLGLNEVFSCFKSKGEDVIVEVPQGSSLSIISNILNESGIVDYPWMFSAYVGVKGNSLKYGKFKLNSSMDYSTIYEILSDSSRNINKSNLVITEGMDIFSICAKADINSNVKCEEVVRELNKKENYSKYKFFKYISESEISKTYYPMEGFCMPDTFYVDSSSNAETIANTILKETDDKLSPLYDDIQNNKLSFWEIMTIASMIQAETHEESEMANISSVLHNRLNNESEFSKLQCDPTYKYAGKIKEDMYKKGTIDIKKADSYDTYTCFGLPAGPICNPGISAIKAALHPSNTNYYFFCANFNSGEVLYATTFEEHKNNISKLEGNQ